MEFPPRISIYLLSVFVDSALDVLTGKFASIGYRYKRYRCSFFPLVTTKPP
jgi:hypothetical protein